MIHSDIEVLDRAGKVYYRLENWETRRFPQPPRLRIDPRSSYISTPWKEPIAAVAGKRSVACCRVDGLPQEFLESSHGVWLQTLAYLVLSRSERTVWDSMQATAKERYDWLLGRCAAKDAVRMVVQERCGVELLRRRCGDHAQCRRPAGGRRHLEAAPGGESGGGAGQFRYRRGGGSAGCGGPGGG